MDTCDIDGCSKPVSAKGKCGTHYKAAWARARREPPSPRPQLIDRLMRSVSKTETCWLWSGTVSDSGYGVISDSSGHPRVKKVHRVVYAHFVGEIPNGMMVCHRCDVPLCVNPEHLWLGTNADNMRDMGEKGRSLFHKRNFVGENHGNSKLTESQVRAIRQRRADGLTFAAIGAEFNISTSSAHLVCAGRSWRHVS